MSFRSHLEHYRSLLDVLAPVDALKWKLAYAYQRRRRNYRTYIRASGFRGDAARGILLRPGTSDLLCFRQVFLRDEYGPMLDNVRDPKLIVDCGANIGLTSAVLAHRFPNARIIAVEPDDANYDLATRNLQQYGSRITLLKAAIWSHACGMQVIPSTVQGSYWGQRVAESSDGALRGIDMLGLLEFANADRIDLLKIDIEGAEKQLFSEGTDRWLPHVDNIVIELHGPECEEPVERALQGFRFRRETSGELKLFMGIHRVAAHQ